MTSLGPHRKKVLMHCMEEKERKIVKFVEDTQLPQSRRSSLKTAESDIMKMEFGPDDDQFIFRLSFS